MNRQTWRACSRDAGFSFVELLVTIIIAGIAFAAMVPVFVGASQKSSGDKMRNIALNVAQDRMEKIRQLDYDQITTANLESATFAGEQFGEVWTTYSGGAPRVFNIAYDLQNVGGSGASPAYVRVKVTVTWTPPPGPVKPVELQTYVSRQYAGPQITNLELTPTPTPVTGEILSVPLAITATVAPGDRASTDKVAFYIFGENGMLVKTAEVKTGQTGNTTPGVYTISWDAVGAGDGQYSFRAQAYLANGDVGNTWARTATLNLTNGLLQVTGLTMAPGDTAITLSWNKVISTKLSHYELWRGDSSGTETKLVDDLTANGYTDTGLVNNHTYYYIVYAVNVDDIAGAPSNEVSGWPGPQTDITPPTMPGSFAVTKSNYSAVLSWLPSTDLILPASGVAGYYVYRSDKGIVPLTTLGPNATRLEDEIGWDKTYSYSVQAFDGVGLLSPKTAVKSVETDEAPEYDLTVYAPRYTSVSVVALFPPYTDEGTKSVTTTGKKTWLNIPYGNYRVTATLSGYPSKTQDKLLTSDGSVTVVFP
jgi:prepilin-type N-terminal cleavage/methylation domain-containing protein